MLGDIYQNVNPFLHDCQAASRRRLTLLRQVLTLPTRIYSPAQERTASMKDTSVGQKETSIVERSWPPELGEWTYADWLKLPDDGYRYEIIDGVLYISLPL
jgi:hypothetical protein